MKKVEFKAAWTGDIEVLNADNLTENEVKVMIAARNNEYGDCISAGSTWSFTVCDNSGLTEKVYRGVVSSLIKKGYIRIGGPRGDAVFHLTDEGKKLYSVIKQYNA